MESGSTFQTMCRICGEECGINIILKGNKIQYFEGSKGHPVNKGFLCPKGKALTDYVYAVDRILHQLKKENGSWKQIDWSEALSICANKLTEIGTKWGPRSAAFMTGEAVGHNQSKWILQRFADVYGTPNVFSVGSLCFHTRVIGHYLTFGQYAIPDFGNSQCIAFWGSNPFNSRPPTKELLERKKKDGTIFITINPVKNELAKISDLYLQIKPGTDCALALGIIHLVLSKSKHDRTFTNNNTIGVEKLKDHVLKYSPSVVKHITGLTEDQIITLADMISSKRPMSIIAASGLDHSLCGTDTHRAICTIQALTGNVNIPGGYIFPPRLDLKNIRLMDRLQGQKPIGAEEYPFYWDIYGEGQGMLLFKSILNEQPYPIKALFIQAMNPVLTWPNAKRTRQALKNVFLVVTDVFHTETTELADLVLPAATTFETNQLRDYGNIGVPIVTLRQRAIEPIPESIPVDVFWLKLARIIGFKDFIPWENEIQVMNALLGPSGKTLEDLINAPDGIQYEVSKNTKESHSYRTPSGKIEFYCERMEKRGLSPLPNYIEPPQPTTDYPLVLCTGARKIEYQHSRLRNIKSLREQNPQPLVELSKQTADKYDTSHHEVIYVETKNGKIKMKASINNDIKDNVISILHGWEGNSNVNELTDDEHLDPVSGFPNLKSVPCRITKW